MNLHFNVDYRTRFGEEVVLNVVNGSETTKYRMMTANGVRWSYNLNMPSVHPDVIDYFYDIERDGRSERREWTTITHRLELDDARGGRYTIYDRWHDIPEDSYLYSSAFTDCLFARKHKMLAPTPFTHTVRLVVRAPQLRARHRLAIVGEGKEFGDWDASKSLPMTEHSYNEWIINLDANMFPDGMMEFKFVAVSDDDREDVIWESGYNRTIKLPVLDSGEVVVYDLNQAFFPIYDARVAGTLVPVFSLRSKHSFGVGDFGDVKRFIDYIALTGQHVLQVLPINDTASTHTWTAS